MTSKPVVFTGHSPETFLNAADKANRSGSRPFSADEFQNFLQLVPLPAFVIDVEGRFDLLNSEASRFLGYSSGELIGEKIGNVLRSETPGRWGEIVKRFSDRPESREICEFVRKDGSMVWCEMFAKPFSNGRWLLFVNDVSERKQAELSFLGSQKQRWKIQKTEALERLAGGIAHDFNNYLAVILLQTDMMNLQLLEDSPLRERVDEIRAVSNDAAGIVRQLLAFGRRQPISPSPIILNEFIQGLSRDLDALVGGKIKIEISLEPDLGVCFVDQKQVAQALMYLTVNARDAMPNGGTLKIASENIVLERTDTQTMQSKGSYIQISVADSGIGMDPSTEDHIFEPFFSTKASDKGAGLGLATVYGIVKQSGGFIWVTSVEGKGTTFKIQFPRIDQPKIVEKTSKPDVPVTTGIETILLVDDDRSVRRLAVESLRRSGYQILEAGSGMEALEIARSFREPIHLILTDLSMPSMSGTDTAQRVKEIHPEISVLFISGSLGDTDTQTPDSAQAHHFLSKPFSASALTLKVREILDS